MKFRTFLYTPKPNNFSQTLRNLTWRKIEILDASVETPKDHYLPLNDVLENI